MNIEFIVVTCNSKYIIVHLSITYIIIIHYKSINNYILKKGGHLDTATLYSSCNGCVIFE